MIDYDYYEKSCYKNKIYHEKCKNYYTKINNILVMISIGITGSTSVSNTITAIYHDDTTNINYISLGYSLLLYISALNNGIRYLLKYEELAEKHRSASSKYKNLYEMIISSSVPIPDFKEIIISEFEIIHQNSPTIPSWIILKHGNEILPTSHNEVSVEIPINNNIDEAINYEVNRLNLQL